MIQRDTRKISYKQLHNEVSKAANGLRKLGIKKGDRVTIYLTMIPELAVTMLACARIGAVHSIIFGGFSADSISGRVNDCESDSTSLLLTKVLGVVKLSL